jgi:DNA-binding beta-propeller fold protein YncE
LHVLPQLRELEHRFQHEIAVVGVHSGKYIAERETSRIRDATQRLDVDHPVVNDRQYRIWRAFAVRAWPTLVVVDPTGAVLGAHAGEFTADMLGPLIEELIATHDASGTLDRRPLVHAADAAASPSAVLRFPGKVAVAGDLLAIADTGHHRILVGTLANGTTRPRLTDVRVFGNGTRGFVDGVDPRFSSPNGITFVDTAVIVADTENHAVRAIDLPTGVARTIAGSGHQLRTRRERASGSLSSPWDVAALAGTVYVAMAGTHQLWALRGDAAHAGADVAAGTGGEDIADGGAGDALLAQPMGVAAATNGRHLYFADAESSAVRALEPDDRRAGRAVGEVHTVVGTGLFDFGDKDGVGDAVRLQHPQGVAVHSSGRLLVADSYNDAIKWVDPVTRRAEAWLRDLHEPGGIAYDSARRRVFVADTNAHRILVVDELTKALAELEIVS